MSTELTVLTSEQITTIMQLPEEHATRFKRAEAYFNENIEPILRIPAAECTEEIDKTLNDFCAACQTTVKDMAGKRAPFFRVVDEYRSIFTGYEKDVSRLAELAKKKRDDVSTYRANLQREQERLAAEQIRLKSLLIDYRQQLQYNLMSFANNKLGELKEKILRSFNTCTLDNIETISQRLHELANEKVFLFSWPSLQDETAFVDIPRDQRQLIFDEEVEKFDMNPIIAQRKEFVETYIGKLPNKKAELEREAAANAEERERIEREREAFRKAEEERINREIEESNQAAKARTEMEAEAEKGQAIFDAIPETGQGEMPKGAKEDAEIKVTSLDGYAKIIALWLRHEAPNVPLEDLPKKAISVMVTYAKKRYLTTGEKIDCPGIQYIDKVSTRAVKK